jgi:hypothetical protein
MYTTSRHLTFENLCSMSGWKIYKRSVCLHRLCGRNILRIDGCDVMHQLHCRQVHDNNWIHPMHRLRRQHVFHDNWQFSTLHMHDLPSELTVSKWRDYLCLHGRLHGRRWCGVLCVCGVDVQGGDWQCTVHRLRDEFRTHGDSADRHHRLCL